MPRTRKEMALIMGHSSETKVRVLRPNGDGSRTTWVQAILPDTWSACVFVGGLCGTRLGELFSTSGRRMRLGKRRSLIGAYAVEQAESAVRSLERILDGGESCS